MNNANCKVVLFSTNKIKTGLFKNSTIINNTNAKQILGAYYAQPHTINFQNTDLLREWLQQVVIDKSIIDQLLVLLKDKTARESAKTRIRELLNGRTSSETIVTKPIYTVGEGVYAVSCLESPNTDGRWITVLCNCIRSMLKDESKDLASLYLFLHASDIKGEENMGEVYKEITFESLTSIQASDLSEKSDVVRIFLFHHVDNVINSVLENYPASEAATIHEKLDAVLQDDNRCRQQILDKEREFVTRN